MGSKCFETYPGVWLMPQITISLCSADHVIAESLGDHLQHVSNLGISQCLGEALSGRSFPGFVGRCLKFC